MSKNATWVAAVAVLAGAVVAQAEPAKPAKRTTPEPFQQDLVLVTLDAKLPRDAVPPGMAFDLGTGGCVAAGEPAAEVVAPRQKDVGAWHSPGGVLVRVGRAGVKIDFPSGQELMVDNRCRVHLRDGSATRTALYGVDLVLFDGSRLVIKPTSSDGRRPLRSVHVDNGVRGQVLWQSGRQTRNASSRRDGRPNTTGLVLHVLGDGRMLYSTKRRGPIVHCERVLCPVSQLADFPRERFVVLGRGLAESLQELPDRMPRSSEEYPAGPETAAFLGQNAMRMFALGVRRVPAGAVGEPVISLGRGFILSVVEGPDESLVIRMQAPRAKHPVVEWVIGRGRSTMLHLVRQDCDGDRTPRYFQRGVVLDHE